MSRPTAGDDKSVWRSWAAAQRQDLPAAVGAAIVEGLVDWLPQAPPGVVLGFLAMADEVDLSDVVRRSDRRCALPRTPAPGGVLTAHPHEADRELHPFGFEQPVGDAEVIPAESIGVVLVPGLVFDDSGGRLGRGGGYYDRFLPTLAAGSAFVGIAPSWLVVEVVPMEPHDVRMTHLATESGVRAVGGG